MFCAYAVRRSQSERSIFQAVAKVFAVRASRRTLVSFGPTSKTTSLRWFVVWLPRRKPWDFARASAALAKHFACLAAISDTSEAPSGGTTFDWFVEGKRVLGLSREHVVTGKLSRTYRYGGRWRDSLDVGLAEIQGGSRQGPWRAARAKRAVDVLSRESIAMSADDETWSALPPEWDGIFLEVGDDDGYPYFFEDYEDAFERPPAPLEAPTATEDATHEAKIETAPDDPAAYLAYGAWLRAHGDPRGELIALQHAGKERAATTLLERAPAHFGQRLVVLPQWRWGYIQSCRVSCGSVAEVEQALAHPSLRFVRRLQLHSEQGDFEFALELLAKRTWTTLSTLSLSTPQQSSYRSSVTWKASFKRLLEKAAPNLTALWMMADSVFVDTPLTERPLVEVCIAAQSLHLKHPIEKLLPDSSRLARLELFGLHDAKTVPRRLSTLFESDRLPNLVRLGLGSSPLADSLSASVARSPLAPRLTYLSFHGGTMTAVGAAELASNAPRLSALTVLDLRENMVDEASAQNLRAAFAKHGATIHVGWAKPQAYVSKATIY